MLGSVRASGKKAKRMAVELGELFSSGRPDAHYVSNERDENIADVGKSQTELKDISFGER